MISISFTAILLSLGFRNEVLGFSVSSLLPTTSLCISSSSSAHANPHSMSRPGSRQTSLQMSSDFDFPSAMPAKPEQTVEEKMALSADDFIVTMTAAVGTKHIDSAPPELESLKALRDQGVTDPSILAIQMYELMIERGMLYDADPETGALTPTEFDIPSNLDIQEVKDEFGYLYKYGMMLMDRGLLTADQVKTTVLERLIKRTGLSPEKFDEWLGY